MSFVHYVKVRKSILEEYLLFLYALVTIHSSPSPYVTQSMFGFT